MDKLRVLVVGGSLEMRSAVHHALRQGAQCFSAEARCAAREAKLRLPEVAVLLHPEAMAVVAEIHGVCPVVAVIPENEDLAQEYLQVGVEEVVFDPDVLRVGVLVRAARRAGSRRTARRQLEQVARMDPLTELLNRRGIEEMLGRLAVGFRFSDTTAVLVDLDDFKAINEERGLAGGDDVLRTVADLLKANARPTDLVARIGGDEFLVVLPGADRGIGETVAERMRRAIEGLGVTASFGLAPVHQESWSVAELVRRTQQCLRKSKHMGKNRLVFRERTDSNTALAAV